MTWRQLATYSRLSYLDLTQNGLTHFGVDHCENQTDNVFQIDITGYQSCLDTLKLKDNELTNFPNLTAHTNLRFVYLESNHIEKITSNDVKMMADLEGLYLQHNCLMHIDFDLPVLRNMQELALQNNPLPAIPDMSTFGLVNLPDLYLEG